MSKYIDICKIMVSFDAGSASSTDSTQAVFLLWDVQIWVSTLNKGGQWDFQHQKPVNQTLGH